VLINDNPHSERFQQLLGEIEAEVDKLKAKISALEKENMRIENELKETKDREADVFSSTKATERMALKHQIKGLVSKIDEHLEE
jgi:regulator of replication initiation timing